MILSRVVIAGPGRIGPASCRGGPAPGRLRQSQRKTRSWFCIPRNRNRPNSAKNGVTTFGDREPRASAGPALKTCSLIVTSSLCWSECRMPITTGLGWNSPADLHTPIVPGRGETHICQMSRRVSHSAVTFGCGFRRRQERSGSDEPVPVGLSTALNIGPRGACGTHSSGCDLEKSLTACDVGGLRSGLGAELGEDVGDVVADRAATDEEGFCDLGIGLAAASSCRSSSSRRLRPAPDDDTCIDAGATGWSDPRATEAMSNASSKLTANPAACSAA
jgi:hypothetical protein